MGLAFSATWPSYFQMNLNSSLHKNRIHRYPESEGVPRDVGSRMLKPTNMATEAYDYTWEHGSCSNSTNMSNSPLPPPSLSLTNHHHHQNSTSPQAYLLKKRTIRE